MGKRKHAVHAGATSVLCAALIAGCGSSAENGADRPAPAAAAEEQPAAGQKLSGKPVTFKWLASDRREAPIRNDWETFQQIFEKTNVKIEFEPVPDGMVEKRQILIATNSVTDFMPVPHTDVRLYGPQGIFLNLSDHLDKTPNIKKFFDQNPEAKALATAADGGIYSVPVVEGLGFNYAWVVRKDLIDKYGLKAPNNPEEFYNLLKALKEKHPDAYPLIPEKPTHDGGDRLFTALLRSFSGLEGYLPLDPSTGKYVFAPDHPGFRETLLYMKRLYDEELLDPEFAIIKGAQWEERLLSGKSLVTWFWKTRVETFNDSAKKSGLIPGYEMDVIPQFAAAGVKNYQYSRNVIGGNGLAISGKVKEKEAAVKFLDYLVGPEGSDYLALGIEGKTYETVNGAPKFLKSLGPGPYAFLRGKFGVWYPDINLDMGKSREAEVLSEKAQAIEDLYKPLVIPAPKQLVLTETENEVQKAKRDNLNKYLDQKISEFIAGRTPIDDGSLRALIEQSVKLGAYELRDMYNKAYERTYGGK